MLRVDPEEWDVGDRQLPPNENGWSAVVSDYAGKKAIRFCLIYIDPQATKVDCSVCGSLGWECDETCACDTASKVFTVEAGWVSFMQISAILRWMRGNTPKEAWYPPQAICQRPFHEHASVLEDDTGPAPDNNSEAETKTLVLRFNVSGGQQRHRSPASTLRAGSNND
eukprot:232912-Rhodomonas_salina.4